MPRVLLAYVIKTLHAAVSNSKSAGYGLLTERLSVVGQIVPASTGRPSPRRARRNRFARPRRRARFSLSLKISDPSLPTRFVCTNCTYRFVFFFHLLSGSSTVQHRMSVLFPRTSVFFSSLLMSARSTNNESSCDCPQKKKNTR